MRPDAPRPSTVGPATGPESPFPIYLSGPIIKGFGRGSSDLGIPTANIPISGLSVGGHTDIDSGVYYGYAGVNVSDSGENLASGTVFPMVMSIGWNPFYKNSVRSVEVHILHEFKHDFYGARMNLCILGFVRPEYDYVSKEALVDDIKEDIAVTRRSLDRTAYVAYAGDPYLIKFEGEGHQQTVTD